MGIGESNGDGRSIRVGFLKPGADYDMDPDTIYVSIHMHGTSVAANAISRKKFKYNTSPRSGEIAERFGNILSTEGYSSHEGFPITRIDPMDFVDMLAKKNDAKVEEYFFQDGLKLSSKLEQIRDLSSMTENFY